MKYIRRIEELIEAPVAMLSTSPERDDTILVKDPFEGQGNGGSASPFEAPLAAMGRRP